MKPGRGSKKRELASFITAVAFSMSLSLCAATPAARAEDAVVTQTSGDFIPGSDRASSRPAATFFTINQVLAKLDRERGRGPNATRLAALAPSNVATDAQPMLKETPAVGTEPFGLFTFRAPDGILWRKWRGVESDLAKDQAILGGCRANAETCPPHAAQFLRLVNAVTAKSGRDQLDEANRAVNQAVRYASDLAQHGEVDRWSAALATFATGRGDCEDYAITKYAALTEAGFPREDLRLVLVRDRAVRQDHAVLVALLDGHWLVLDSRRSDLMDDSEATSLTPLFAISYRGVQLFAAPYAQRELPDGETSATPASASGSEENLWTGQEITGDSGPTLGSLPLLI